MVLVFADSVTAKETVKYIYYSDFGAVGDGVTDDFDAIVKAHAAANAAGLPVRANAGATYYIGGANQTAQIQTDTDWSGAKFIIDDVNVENRESQVFNISSKLPPVEITTIKTLKKGQTKLDLSLPHNSLVIVIDNETMRYIREGLNLDNGSPQTDVFLVDKNGNVDEKTPIIWDFDNISSIIAYPIDTETLTVKGGHFTRIANQAESNYTYYFRGIGVKRSNVLIDSLYHIVTGELEHGAPYNGFIRISDCAEVMVQNCTLSGRKTYTTIGRANAPVPMGTYDILVNRSINVTFKNCKQTNCIHDTEYWGIFGSNYSKNLVLDNVKFSRFDAHKGVLNATIRNSELGHQGINLIGKGLFLIENSKSSGWSFINLRSDYGSTWEGEFVIRNCEFNPRNGQRFDAVLISGRYSGQHDVGYKCFMPRKITIDGLFINDSNPPLEGYSGPKLFFNLNSANTSEAFIEKYPYTVTEEVFIKNLTTKSGLPLVVSNNPFMFRGVRVLEEE
jgi:hypothetical protein